jgi:hypothetical protein
MLVPGQLVTVGPERGVVVDPAGLDVPEDEVAVWFGQVAPNGDLQVFTVKAIYAISFKQNPQVYR